MGWRRGGRWIDVSLPISPELPVYPGDPPVEIRAFARQSRGDASNGSVLTMGTHTGTHIDPPSHFLPRGLSVDQLDPATLIGPAWVVDLDGVRRPLTPGDLAAAGIPRGTERLLIRTVGSDPIGTRRDVDAPYAGLSLDAARWLVEAGVRLLGIDTLSVEGSDPPFEHPIHRLMLEAGMVIVENLELSEAPAGPCELVCLPLRIEGGDGSPARALIRLP